MFDDRSDMQAKSVHCFMGWSGVPPPGIFASEDQYNRKQALETSAVLVGYVLAGGGVSKTKTLRPKTQDSSKTKTLRPRKLLKTSLKAIEREHLHVKHLTLPGY